MFAPVSKGKWRTTRELPWNIGYKDSGLLVTVPKGFSFDGASAPWFSWFIIRPEDPRVMEAAAFHDYLYHKQKFARITADSIFYNIMRERGFPRWRSIIAWLAVRLVNRWR